MAKGKYAKKRNRKLLRETMIWNTQLSTHTVNALVRAGINNLAELKQMDWDEISKIRGIGNKAMSEIREAFSELDILSKQF